MYDVRAYVNRPVEGELVILIGDRVSALQAVSVAADYLARVGNEIFPDAFVTEIKIEAV